ncbi:polysaccharide deacetylase family protein [Paenarthrobacter sp. DKR-5]|uniref:polysaccharide deacetylase family protein n=1 Tax=Paenarthrobacter sp. DKR-5 TaxID=2835535 RepID=UPI001BDC4BD7|nr:polysaccharide deacetylase family protein [Paenarthrobacter sp. DKR-5]MBT1004350.1 polysaccharide deacetylase family protein [Paenarthrobacter sp. DKR-5]
MKPLWRAGAALAALLLSTLACGIPAADARPPGGTGGGRHGMVSVTFDDGWASQFQHALPVLERYGIPATLYLISGSIGDSPSYMTASQVKAFAARGDEIAAHTVTHPHLTQLSAARLDAELRQGQADLRRLFGASAAVDFASPYGEYNDATLKAIRKYYATQRSTDTGYNTAAGYNPSNLLVQNIDAHTSAATVRGWAARAESSKSWLILVYHEIGASLGGDIYHSDTAVFEAQMREIDSSPLEAVTVREGAAALAGQ